jgi:acyl carrier protein
MSSTLSFDSAAFANPHSNTDPVAAALQSWLCKYIGQILNIAPDQIDPDVKFDRHGLDSSAAVGLAGDLSTWLGCDLDPTLTYDFPTVTELSAELARREEIRTTVHQLV